MNLLAGFLLVFLFAAPTDLQYFRYWRTVDRGESKPGQTCLIVEPGIFAHAAAQLADLRVYRDQTETPFALWIPSPPAAPVDSIAPHNLGTRGGKIAFDAEMPNRHYSPRGTRFRGTKTKVTGSFCTVSRERC